jgi:hypothetical protein
MTRSVWIRNIVLACCVGTAAATSHAQPPSTAEQAKFFDLQVLPILQAHCFTCHGNDKEPKSGLRLTSREGLLKGGKRGAAVSLEKPEDSRLLQAIHYGELKMPPRGKLPTAHIDVLTRWVKMGVPFGEGVVEAVRPGPPKVDDRARGFWAFQPVVRPAVPPVRNRDWVRNPIDAFILAKLEEKGFQPAAPADRTSLLRRAYYAVTGLPPTPEEVDAFLADSAADAYEKAVDRLLASRHFGEHWGRHWLDLVRYAESNSFERDGTKPFVWRYRDYVIRSFNLDKPYDRFIREQLAGDELDEVTEDSLIATGYYRLGLWDDEPADPLLAYFDGLDDIQMTTGQTFLGLTVNCARCHDHKIDPFPQRDYYRMLSFFRGIRHYGVRSDESVREASLRYFGGDEAARKRQQEIGDYRKKLGELDRKLKAIEDPLRNKLPGGEIDDFKHEPYRIRILRKHVPDLIGQEDLDRYIALHDEREDLLAHRPAAAQLVLCVTEEGTKAPETFIFQRGNPNSRGDKVEPGFPSVLLPPGSPELLVPAPAKDAKTTGRRKLLAGWIADRKNPLTGRVMVNRVWQYTFGRGIVRSTNNFGYAGTPPTHPELLDWLASEFADQGMKVKSLVRLILTSNAFRMAAVGDATLAATDPENDLLGHFDLRRLTAEEVRDSVLAACGNLNRNKSSGPSVYPLIPREVLAGQSMPGNNWGKSTPEEAASRSVFIHVKRSLAVPELAVFDAADADAPCPVRFTTTQPTQALAMLNGDFIRSQAAVFADSLRQEAGAEPADQVRLGLRRVLQRAPRPGEVDRGIRFMNMLRERDKLTAEEALTRFCLLALNLNEFVYLD